MIRAALRHALDRLDDPRQRYILECHYGFDRGEPQTVRQIGAALGVTGARVSQLETAAIAKLSSLPTTLACRRMLAS